jgi:hypothetical protein
MSNEYPALSADAEQALVWWRFMGRRYDLSALPCLVVLQPVEDIDMTLQLLTTIAGAVRD